jgi:hypothetical protein
VADAVAFTGERGVTVAVAITVTVPVAVGVALALAVAPNESGCDKLGDGAKALRLRRCKNGLRFRLVVAKSLGRRLTRACSPPTGTILRNSS